MNCKKAITEEVEIAKKLDAKLNFLKEAPGTRQSWSPPIRSNISLFPNHWTSIQHLHLHDAFMILLCGLHQGIYHPEANHQEFNLVQENPPKVEPWHVLHQRLEHLEEAQNLMGVKEALWSNHQLPLTLL
jgi:hypothetical protein